MNRHGFTTIELIMVLVIIGLIAAFGIPRIRDAVIKSNVRSAKVSLGTLVVKARAAAVARGCNATLTLTSGSTGTASVTVCNVNGSGNQVLGGVDSLAARYKLTMTPSSGTLTFDPRGLSTSYATLIVRFTSTSLSPSISDSVIINQLGEVVRQ